MSQVATPKDKEKRQQAPWLLDASYVARAHTILASTAFTTALVFALLLHYKKVVKNGVAGYPDEWWPSVSATCVIGLCYGRPVG